MDQKNMSNDRRLTIQQVLCPVCRRKRLLDISGFLDGDFEVIVKCNNCGPARLSVGYLKQKAMLD